MSRNEQITFTVLAQTSKGAWEAKGQADEMHAAVSAAKQMAQSKRFQGVKVDQTFVDASNGRRVSSTIFHEGGARNGPPMMLWVGLATLAGLISFGITYTLTL